MGTQISIKLSDRMFASAKVYAETYGFDTLQDFIRELIREQLFERESEVTYKASEESLARHWLSPEEDKAWAHLQKEHAKRAISWLKAHKLPPGKKTVAEEIRADRDSR